MIKHKGPDNFVPEAQAKFGAFQVSVVGKRTALPAIPAPQYVFTAIDGVNVCGATEITALDLVFRPEKRIPYLRV